MSKSNYSTISGGISTSGLLGVVFITLKLCHIIDWSWWWVTCPFWVGIAIFAAVMATVGLFMLIGLFVTVCVAAITSLWDR